MAEDQKNRSTTSRIFEKVESIEMRLQSIDMTLLKQHLSLDEHMRRTEIIEKELQPVVKHVEQMRGAAKLLGILALIATIISVYAALH